LTRTLDGREDADIVWYDLGLVLQYSENFKAALEAFDRAIALRDRSRYRHARTALLGIEDKYLERMKRQQ
jgi:lipoprotein NlpI